jgi:hypothetical protein
MKPVIQEETTGCIGTSTPGPTPAARTERGNARSLSFRCGIMVPLVLSLVLLSPQVRAERAQQDGLKKSSPGISVASNYLFSIEKRL